MEKKIYDIVIFGNYTKDTIVSKTGTRYVDGGGFNYGAQAAAKSGMSVAAVTRLAEEFNLNIKGSKNREIYGVTSLDGQGENLLTWVKSEKFIYKIILINPLILV